MWRQSHDDAAVQHGDSGCRKTKERKRFFLKKEAKTFVHWHRAWIGDKPLKSKSFLVLFFKKERFLAALGSHGILAGANTPKLEFERHIGDSAGHKGDRQQDRSEPQEQRRGARGESGQRDQGGDQADTRRPTHARLPRQDIAGGGHIDGLRVEIRHVSYSGARRAPVQDDCAVLKHIFMFHAVFLFRPPPASGPPWV
jgi:hypothetical protein